jgi:hypothetical protein
LGVTETIVDYALVKARIALKEHARQTLFTFVKLVLPGFLAITLIGLGVTFVLVGIVVFLAELMITSLAWEIVGLASLLAGLVTLLIIRWR